MNSTPRGRRRPAVRITLGRAARLHRLLSCLAHTHRSRDELLAELGVGLRTFYRELELVRRCGVKIRQERGAYSLRSTLSEAEARLPFPDPQLNFAEMAELSRLPGDAARRLAELLASVTSPPAPPGKAGRRRKTGQSSH